VTATRDQWTSVSIDPLKTFSPVVGYEIEFEDVNEQAAFVPLYIPEGTTPSGNETSVLYFKADINMNNLASYGGIISYTLNSDPESDQGSSEILLSFYLRFKPIDKNKEHNGMY